jgi:O-antigen/teichoic acid export membrane protein
LTREITSYCLETGIRLNANTLDQSACLTEYSSRMEPSELDMAMPQATAGRRHVDFFRQSSWLIFAAFASGALMWLVHFLNKFLPKEEYGTLGTLMTSLILVPTIPLQLVFARQTAAALAKGRPQVLTAMLRFALTGTFGVWALGALVVLFLRDTIIARWEIANPSALWLTLAVILVALWTSLFAGILQGSQRFKWLGWIVILQGVGRIGTAAFLVIVLRMMSAGIMAGVLIGCLIGLLLAMWFTRDLWLTRSAPFDRSQFLRQIAPLILGCGCSQFLLSADTIFVNAFFDREQTAYYFAAGTLCRALIWAVGPLVTVMFPKMVHSSERAEKTNLLAVTMAGATVLVVVGAIALWLLGPLVVHTVYDPTYVAPTLAILPWYAGAIVPLCLASVVVNHLYAKHDFRIVLWLVALAAGYTLAVIEYHPSVIAVLQLLAASCTALFLIGAWLTWSRRPD